MPAKTLFEAISDYGKSVAAKLSSPAIKGQPEDQLRGPLETLIVKDLAGLSGQTLPVDMIGETNISDKRIRPDYAVTLGKALVGYIEVKAPGKGADPRRFTDAHDKAQWTKLKSLPNLIYTDGSAFSLWQDGELVGKVVPLDGDIETAGGKLTAPDSLLGLFANFFAWSPIAPNTPRKLAEVSARLCRLLRDEVTEQLGLNHSTLVGLANDWRKLLFPEATDENFADGYAQAVTFGLLIARTRDISLVGGIERAASELKKSNSLIGTALNLLTENSETHSVLRTSLDTMTRVLDQVNWSLISRDDPDAWLYFYEHFLEVYDNNRRKQTGSYYTPPEVVNAMVRLVDEVLRGPLFNRSLGLASADVTVADPAVGTGTFLLGVLRRIAANVEEDRGPGGVQSALADAAKRLVGFELQFGPYAVAQLRLIAELQELVKASGGKAAALIEMRLFITDTLSNPFVESETLQIVEPIAKSRREANKVKREETITVVIGNPPYKEKAEGLGGWIEKGSGDATKKDIQAPMDRWRPPVEWGVSAHAKHLKNLYVYFWRWATWKVFRSGWRDSTGLAETDEEGVVCIITVAGYLNGPGFQKLRADLRASCSEIWVIDCSPEGHQPEVATRIFQGVQQPVCIVIAARRKSKDASTPAVVRYARLAEGRREHKFAELEVLTLRSSQWVACPSGWRDPFLPLAIGQWAEFPALKDLFAYDGSGVMPGRTWIIAPDRETLSARWKQLVDEKDSAKKETLFHPHLRDGGLGDKHVGKMLKKGLPGHEERLQAVAIEKGGLIAPARYAFRSFDRQWIIPDARLINQPNPKLWNDHSDEQVYMTAVERVTPTSGPSLSFCAVVPDLDHYHGRGGRVFPLWANFQATNGNLSANILSALADTTNLAVSAPDMMAYIAAVLAHPFFTEHFADDLVQPGLRVPLTSDPVLSQEAVELGREVIWLHTYGERYVDAAAGRPKGPPRMAKGEAPTIPAGGAIPEAPEPLPEAMTYDAPSRRLHVGIGYIDNVTPEMWAYEVSGKQVVWQWFSYRRRDRTKPKIGDRRPPSPLDAIQPESWLPEYTTDLVNLLNVLGRLVALEPRQADLLNRILTHPLITVADLHPPVDNTPDS
jgi:hypothetical protein